jgi:hypothetical protein
MLDGLGGFVQSGVSMKGFVRPQPNQNAALEERAVGRDGSQAEEQANRQAKQSKAFTHKALPSGDGARHCRGLVARNINKAWSPNAGSRVDHPRETGWRHRSDPAWDCCVVVVWSAAAMARPATIDHRSCWSQPWKQNGWLEWNGAALPHAPLHL